MRTLLPRTIHELGRPASASSIDDGGVLRVTCPQCGGTFTKRLTVQERKDVMEMYYHGGRHPRGPSQKIFPAWSPADRELFLMSHLCDSCWKRIFGDPDLDDVGVSGDTDPGTRP